jgi:hypothetical protein
LATTEASIAVKLLTSKASFAVRDWAQEVPFSDKSSDSSVRNVVFISFLFSV